MHRGQRLTFDSAGLACDDARMSRPLRVQFEGAAYHVSARGNERRAIFRDDTDRRRFLQTLGETCGQFGLVVHAYCLMLNHYHLLVRTPRANLSQAMGWLQTTGTIRFNRRHRRSGHLFQGRFKAHLVDADAYARQLVRYIHLNPVRPRDRKAIVPRDRRRYLDRYAWSSHRAYSGFDKPPDWLSMEWLAYWGDRAAAARRQYLDDIAAAFGERLASPLAELRGGLVLGGEKLWRKARALITATGKEKLRWRRRAAENEAHAVALELVSEDVFAASGK